MSSSLLKLITQLKGSLNCGKGFHYSWWSCPAHGSYLGSSTVISMMISGYERGWKPGKIWGGRCTGGGGRKLPGIRVLNGQKAEEI